MITGYFSLEKETRGRGNIQKNNSNQELNIKKDTLNLVSISTTIDKGINFFLVFFNKFQNRPNFFEFSQLKHFYLFFTFRESIIQSYQNDTNSIQEQIVMEN